jgi:hypothetical protein
MLDDYLKQSAIMSSTAQMRQLPVFQLLRQEGQDIIAPALKALQNKPSVALMMLLGDVAEEMPEAVVNARGRVSDMAKAWIAWGKREGFLGGNA